MPTLLRLILPALLFGSIVVTSATCVAQENDGAAPESDEANQSWYQQPPTYQPNPRAIIHEKALIRYNQRQARLAAMNWYGMYNARPTAAPTPFTSLYSPAWQQPGGRPFAWYASSRPTYVFYR